MLRNLFTLLVLSFFISLSTFGQERSCATTESNKLLKNRYKNRTDISDYNSFIKSEIEKTKQLRKTSRTEEDTVIIPVIVHVIHNGDTVGTNENISFEQVQSQFDVLNEDFQRKAGTLGGNSNTLVGTAIPIKFLPAIIDPNGNLLEEPGIHRVDGGRPTWDDLEQIDTILKKATVFDPTRYLNIWVVTFGGSLKSKLGYAQFPDFSSLSGIDDVNGVASTDGLVIRFNAFGRVGTLKYPFHLGRTVTHEMGHFLGLLHIWGNENDNSSCINDDGCDDTPKTTGPITGCPSSVGSCEDGVEALKEDYMDYANDACMNLFTVDQKDRIYVVLANSPRRKELVSSLVYNTPEITANFRIADTTTGCYPKQLTFTDASSGYTKLNSWSWTITGTLTSTSPIVSHAKNLKITFNIPDKYKASLVVGNISGQKDTLVKTFFIHDAPDVKIISSSASNTVNNCQLVSFTATGANKYLWQNNLNSQRLNGPAFYSIFPESDITISVTGTSIYGCADKATYSMNVIAIDCSAGTADELESQIKLYPNPFDENLNIEIDNTIGQPLEITLSNIQGVEVKTGKADKSSDKNYSFSTGNLPKGIYFIKVQTNAAVFTRKLIKQ